MGLFRLLGEGGCGVRECFGSTVVHFSRDSDYGRAVEFVTAIDLSTVGDFGKVISQR